MKNDTGLTLVEIVIATALLAILVTAGFMVANPYGQLATARNNQRALHLQALAGAIRQNIAEQSGQSFACSSGSVPTTTKKMASGAGNYDIGPCLVPIYMLTLPYDPSASSAHYASNADYDTGYNILFNASTSQITLSAPSAELNKTVSILR